MASRSSWTWPTDACVGCAVLDRSLLRSDWSAWNADCTAAFGPVVGLAVAVVVVLPVAVVVVLPVAVVVVLPVAVVVPEPEVVVEPLLRVVVVLLPEPVADWIAACTA